MPSKITSINLALKQAASKLLKVKIDSAWLDAELLLAFALGKDRSFVLAHEEKTLTKIQNKKFDSLIKQRLKFVPLAHLLGYKEFFGLKFKINKNTLVPRPESELLVETALELSDNNSLIIDIGTGSGCLIISVIKNTGNKGIALDISNQALAVAKQNAKSLKVNNKIKFIKSNLLLI